METSTKKKNSTTEEVPQIIQLLNKKIIIKSTSIELLIPDGGVLKIIPAEASSSFEAECDNLKVQKKNPRDVIVPALNDNPTSYQHPLQNHMIAKNIGCYLSSTDLAAARQTCKLWSNTLKSYQTVKLSDSNLKSFLKNQSQANAAESCQFANYALQNISFQTKKVCTLFKDYGKYMTKLRIFLYFSSSAELNMDQFRSIILANIPNLEEFDFSDYSGDSETSHNKFWNQGAIFNKEFPRKHYLPKLRKIKFKLRKLVENYENAGFMNDLLNTSNNLEHLSFTSDRSMELIRSNPNKAIISALKNKTCLEHFKALRLDYLSYNETLELIKLSERKINKLQLSELKFNVSNQAPDGTIISVDTYAGERFSLALDKLLKLQGKSLKSLELNTMYGSSSAGFTLQIPTLAELKRLVLFLIGKGMKCSFDGGSILKNFPSLKTLDYDTYDDHDDDDKDFNIEWGKHMTLTNPHSSVTQLHFGQFINCWKLYRLYELFPNVTRLYVDVESIKVIQGLWNKWPQLQCLTIKCPSGLINDDLEVDTIDECITGIPREHHNSCLMLCKSSIYSNTDDILKGFKLMPGISDLKYLTKLDFTSDINMSDVSAYFGFIHSKSVTLTHLVIEDPSNLSLECQHAIHAKLGSQAYIQLGKAK